MGSTGSGSFSDYSGATQYGSGNESSGGSSGTDRCRQAFSVGLEDVAQYPYYENAGSLPTIGTPLSIAQMGRLVALDNSGVVVGALPTRFNYLAGCIADGIQYSGVVTFATGGTNPQVNVDFASI